MTEEIQLTIADELHVYEKIETEIAQAERTLSSLKGILKDSERRVIEAFEKDGITDITYNGRRWKPEAINTVKITSSDGDKVAAAMKREAVTEWLITSYPITKSSVKSQMNAARQDALLREYLIDADDGSIKSIPVELEGIVEEYQDVKLNKRKV